ncbi:hypothetical protein S14_35 [Shewanella sp. phage 1/4]|uniref:hypothetical protein n=1 Tax=Shewanella phage 1/4 TaxID=1458859 RepID=UPI0004F90F13|nr:hypothetical protein S14_35 [Shewanella sp. phage 1/4]AHK11147.1 hypothetical protein S14_35 [Shewanella sp. phage 1/4]
MSYFKHMKDKGASPCSVSIEVVNHVASLMPQYLTYSNGDTNIPRVLFMLGFQVDSCGNGYAKYDNVIIRNKDRPYMTHTTCIFNGRVRKEVSHQDEYGNVIFDKNRTHFMERVYIENEILTLAGLDSSVMMNINKVGIKKFYEDGMAALDKRVDPEKPIRNIVRP